MDFFTMDNTKVILVWLIEGKGSDWVFDVLVANSVKFISTNFIILWALNKAFKTYAAGTENKTDDKISNWFNKILTRFKPTTTHIDGVVENSRMAGDKMNNVTDTDGGTNEKD